MTRHFKAIGFLACAVLCGLTPGISLAQTTNAPTPAPVAASVAPPPVACSGNAAATPPDTSGAGSGYPDSSYEYMPPAAPTDPKPANPTPVKVCDNGSVMMQVGNSREYAYQIGDEIDVTVILVVNQGTMFDYSSLVDRQRLSFKGSDFRLMKRPDAINIDSQDVGNNKTQVVIRLRLQALAPVATPVFSLDLRYANSFLPGTIKPDWKVLTTPDFVVTINPTLDAGDQLKQGDMSFVAPGNQSIGWWLAGTGGALFLSFWIYLLANWLRRVWPGREIPANEAAWQTLSRVFAEGDAHGFKERHVQAAAATIKTYLGATLSPGVAAQAMVSKSRAEIASMLGKDARGELVANILGMCDNALYAVQAGKKSLINSREAQQLRDWISRVVPQPEK